MKYEDMKDQYNTDEYGFQFVGKYKMIAEEPKPCMICSDMTKTIDVFSEGYICSEECQHKFDSWCNDMEKCTDDECGE